jgi:hypothetical protein
MFVMMKEQHAMDRRMKQERFPEGMALVETADCRWFPACAYLSEIPHRIDSMEDPPLIPPALDTFHDPEPGYDCHVWREEEELTEYWRRLAACTELFPERTAWYLDEIVQLAGDDTPRLHCVNSVHAMVLARQTTGNEVIDATGNTPDEAIETLYQHVYQWSCQKHDTTCES